MSCSSSVQKIYNPYFSGLVSFPEHSMGKKILICLPPKQKHLAALEHVREFQVAGIGLTVLVFEKRKKPEHSGKNLSKQRRKPTSNQPTNDIDRQDLSPGNIGGRRVISP